MAGTLLRCWLGLNSQPIYRFLALLLPWCFLHWCTYKKIIYLLSAFRLKKTKSFSCPLWDRFFILLFITDLLDSFLLKNFFPWYEWLETETTFQLKPYSDFLQWNQLFPTSCPCLLGSSVLLSGTLQYSDILLLGWQNKTKKWLADTNYLGLKSIFFSSLSLDSQSHNPTLQWQLLRGRPPFMSMWTPGEEEAAGCWYWDLVVLPSGPKDILLCRVFLLFPLVLGQQKKSSSI